jgi:hypothetical protein
MIYVLKQFARLPTKKVGHLLQLLIGFFRSQQLFDRKFVIFEGF